MRFVRATHGSRPTAVTLYKIGKRRLINAKCVNNFIFFYGDSIARHPSPQKLDLFWQPVNIILCEGFVVEYQIEDTDNKGWKSTADDVDDFKNGDGLHVEPARWGAHQFCSADDLKDAKRDGQ